MTTTDEKRRLRRLHKQAAERLLDDSRLWDGLPDDQAQQLLKWGVDQIKRLLPQVSDMSDEEAEAWLDDQITAVAKMMTEIKMLTPELGNLDVGSLQSQLRGLLDNLQAVTGEAISERSLNRLTRNYTRWDAAELFQQLLQMLGFEPDDS